MGIFSYEIARRIGDQNVLRKFDALMDWSAISVLLKNGLKRSGLGPQGYKEITLFKCLLIGQWHNLSDPKLEQSLRVRFDFMLFAGLDLHGSVPDETTHCRFRNALVKADAYDALLAEVCRQIENHGLKVKEADAAIIDATLIESAAHPRTHVEAPVKIGLKMRTHMSLLLLSLALITTPDGSRRAVRVCWVTRVLPDAMKKGLWMKSIPRLLMLVRAHSLKP